MTEQQRMQLWEADSARGGRLSRFLTGAEAGSAAYHGPCLLIGLGGQGVLTLQNIREELNRNNDPAWSEKTGVELMAVDADEISLTRGLGSGRLDPDRECCLLNHWNAMAGLHLYDWLNPDLAWNQGPFETSLGTGGIRQQGRYLLALPDNTLAVETMLADKLKRLACGSGGRRIRVIVIAGLCGGFGSSLLIDLPYLVRHTARNLAVDTAVEAMVYLPDAYSFPEEEKARYQKDYMLANAYAALKELDYHMGLAARRESYELTYGGNEQVRSTENIYTSCCLVDGVTDAASSVRKESAVRAVTEYICSLLTDLPFREQSMNLAGLADPAAAARMAAVQAGDPQQTVCRRYWTLGCGIAEDFSDYLINRAAAGLLAVLHPEDASLSEEESCEKAAVIRKSMKLTWQDLWTVMKQRCAGCPGEADRIWQNCDMQQRRDGTAEQLLKEKETTRWRMVMQNLPGWEDELYRQVCESIQNNIPHMFDGTDPMETARQLHTMGKMLEREAADTFREKKNSLQYRYEELSEQRNRLNATVLLVFRLRERSLLTEAMIEIKQEEDLLLVVAKLADRIAQVLEIESEKWKKTALMAAQLEKLCQHNIQFLDARMTNTQLLNRYADRAAEEAGLNRMNCRLMEMAGEEEMLAQPVRRLVQMAEEIFADRLVPSVGGLLDAVSTDAQDRERLTALLWNRLEEESGLLFSGDTRGGMVLHYLAAQEQDMDWLSARSHPGLNTAVRPGGPQVVMLRICMGLPVQALGRLQRWKEIYTRTPAPGMHLEEGDRIHWSSLPDI